MNSFANSDSGFAVLSSTAIVGDQVVCVWLFNPNQAQVVMYNFMKCMPPAPVAAPPSTVPATPAMATASVEAAAGSLPSLKDLLAKAGSKNVGSLLTAKP